MSAKITKKELVEKFNELYHKLGRVPTRDQMGHREPIKRIFGNYNNFLRAMGHFPNFLRNKEDYIRYIKTRYKELGRVPSANDLINRKVYPLSIYKMFGSYNKLLELAGLESKKMTHTDKSDEELLLDYIEYSNKINRWATTRELESIDIYENRFGSIIQVRKLVVNSDRLTIENKTIKEASYQKYTDKEIEQYVISAIETYSHKITKKEFVEYLKSVNGPSINTVTKRHKSTSFRNMIEMYRTKYKTKG